MLGNLPSSVNLFITKIIVWMDVDRLGCQSLHLFLMLLHIILMDVDCLGVYHKSDRYTLEGGRPIVERLLLVRWG